MSLISFDSFRLLEFHSSLSLKSPLGASALFRGRDNLGYLGQPFLHQSVAIKTSLQAAGAGVEHHTWGLGNVSGVEGRMDSINSINSWKQTNTICKEKKALEGFLPPSQAMDLNVESITIRQKESLTPRRCFCSQRASLRVCRCSTNAAGQ